jgi:RNA polymerase-binding transcription factor DksA
MDSDRARELPTPIWLRATSILGDQVTELQDDELSAGLRDQLADEARRRRGSRGTSGERDLRVSIESGEPIPDERLEAHPTAERTTEEQARLER